ncbi:MAG: TIGR04086 family membrane protein [Actinomycetota bacterium]|nr:TIGR04086 family membrane protein [Actinomycetota bacterium]
MGRRKDRNVGGGRPVEPEEARAHENDPDAVEVHRLGERDGEPYVADDRRAEHETVGARRPVAVADKPLEPQSPDLVMRRDSARWGPIWAGLITAITTFILLQLLAIGLGLVGIGPQNTGSAWVPAIVGLIAFFTGGAVAGMTSSVRGAATGFLNGFLVWALGTVLILVLSALGLGSIFGALGGVVGQLGLFGPGGASLPSNVPNVDPAQIASAVRTGAISAFFGLLVSAIASALGGYLGARSDEPIGHMAQDND